MEAVTGSLSGGVRVRRQWLAAALVLLAVPVGVITALVTSELAAAWITAGTAVASSLVVLAGSPRAGSTASRWRLLGAGLALWAAGLVVAASTTEGGSAPILPGWGDGPELAGLLLVGWAIGRMAVARALRNDWIARLDAVLVGIGASVVPVVFLWPDLRAADLGAEAELASAAAVGMAALLLGVAFWLAITGASRLAAGRFATEGVAGLAVGTVLVRAGELRLPAAGFGRVGAGLVASGALVLAAAAISPSAMRITERERTAAHDLPRRRLVVLVLAVAAGPVSAMVQQLRDEAVDGLVVGGVTTALLILVGVRLELVARSSRAQAEREAIVREAAGAIGASPDAPSIRRVALDTARSLLGPDLRYVSWIGVNHRGAPYPMELVGPHGAVDRAEAGVDGALRQIDGWLARARRVVDDTHSEVVIVPIPCRVGAQAGLAVAGVGRVSEEVDESLTLLGTQAGLALDALVQSSELRDKRSDARFQQLVRHSSDAVLIVGHDGRIRYQNPSVVRVLGFLAVDLDGAPFDRVLHPDSMAHVASFLDQLGQAPGETVRMTEARLVRADDSVIHTEIAGVQLLDNPDVQGIVLTIRDVTGRHTLEDQLRHQAFHDALTGLSNRALFLDRVEHALARIRRSDSPVPAVAFIDLDDFKLVNDRLGHGAGDEVLRAVADRLRASLRSGDTPARLGGDEFAVLLEDAPDTIAVVEVAERVLDSLRPPIHVEGQDVYVRASIGIATRSGLDATPESLLRNADLAMYTAKAGGKGRIELFEPEMHHRAVDRLAVRADLERAVERGEIEVAYQPIVRLASGEVVAFEALARWSHAARGIVAPSEFLPIAEDTGLILQLGQVVLEQACAQLHTWLAANPGSSWQLGVNVSARELLGPDLVTIVSEALDAAGLDPGSLILEIGEPALLSDSEGVLRRLHRLKDLGVQIAIDDFGTGYSALSYLQRVPFDILKVDRAFVAALRHEDPQTTLARTILDLGRTLGRSTIAEGIEEQVEVDGLLALGYELGQGRHFGAAVDAATLERDLGLLPPSGG